MKYVVVEIQTDKDGKIASIVTPFDDYYQAESKYHTVLAAAAISPVPLHAAVLMDNYGQTRQFQSYEKDNETEGEA